MSSWDRMGNRPIRLEEDMLRLVGLDDSDELFKELDEFIMNADLKEFEDERKVVVEGKEKDFEEKIKELIGEGMGVELLGIDIDKVTSDNLEDFLNVNADQANIQELEQRLERMNEWVENQPTGQITSYTQPNPTLSNNQDDQGWRYQTPNQRKEKVNAISTRSGFGYGDEEERNENENEKFAELGTTAQQHTNVLRSNGRSECFPKFVDQLVATQSLTLRRSYPSEPENDPEVDLEVENQVGDEPMIPSKVKELKTRVIIPLEAYKPRIPKKEDELEKERKPTEWSEVQGIQDFIDRLISYLTCRTDDSFGKFGTANFHDVKGRCKCVCMCVGYLMMVVILANTKKWNDAIVKVFEKFFVAMETCDGYNIVCFICLF